MMMPNYTYYTYVKYVAFAIVTAFLPLLALLVLKVVQKLTAGRCRSLVCLNGKTAIVTGGNSGIGFKTALNLASRGCRVIIADHDDSPKSKNKIIARTNNNNIIVKHLDLASLKSIREFAKDINATEKRLDIIINNAAVGSAGNKHTSDGLHKTMQINHFGPFLLTHLLTDLLKKSAPSRIVFVSSATAFGSTLSASSLNYPEGHSPNVVLAAMIYANSKLCNVIAANGFAARLRDFGVTSNSLHPGLVNTGIYVTSGRVLGLEQLSVLFRRTLLYVYGKSSDEGAQTTIALAVSNKLKNVTGKHFWDCRSFMMPPKAWNKTLCDDVWEQSEKYVELSDGEKLIETKQHDS